VFSWKRTFPVNFIDVDQNMSNMFMVAEIKKVSFINQMVKK